jgi:hypothetical protein
MEQNTELEDIIEDVTVEQLAAGLELEQESSIVSEEQVVETEEVTLEEAKEESEEEEKSEETEEEEEETIEEGKNPEVVDDGEGDFKIVGASGKVARYFKRSEYGGMAKQIAQASLKKNLDKYMKEEDVKEESYAADLAALTESEANLTESFKEKAAIIFEAALTSKIREEKEKLAEQFETQLSEQTAQLREDLEDKVDNYLTYVVESWVEDNKVAVESGLRAEIAENFIGALKTVFVENYIEVPESKKDMVSELEAELAAIKESATQSQSDAVILSERV